MVEREWVTLTDPADAGRRYTFDVSFLCSDYSCVFGAGCEGLYPGAQDPAVGCCLHGAYLEDATEAERLENLIDEHLDARVMQFHDDARGDGATTVDEEGEPKTRVLGGACIFANRSSFDGPPGCALHHLAVGQGLHHMTYKPTVCWQVPLHRTIDELVGNDGETIEVHTIAAFERGHWGEGGAAFDWWCLDDGTAFGGGRPLYRSMEHELTAMVGRDVYDELAAHLDARLAGSRPLGRFLPIAPNVDERAGLAD